MLLIDWQLSGLGETVRFDKCYIVISPSFNTMYATLIPLAAELWFITWTIYVIVKCLSIRTLKISGNVDEHIKHYYSFSFKGYIYSPLHAHSHSPFNMMFSYPKSPV